MKRILFAVMTLAVLCACNDNDKVCTISGTLTDPVDSVRLVDMSGEQLDVAAVKDGAFTLKCEIDPETGVSIIRGAMPTDDYYYTEEAKSYDPIPLIPDVKKISVTVTDSVPVIAGSPLSTEIQEFQQWAMSAFFENMENVMAMMADGDSIGAETQYAEGMRQMAGHCREVYQKHKSDAIGVQALSLLVDFVDKDEYIALYEQGGKAVKADANLGGYYEHLQSLPEEGVITLLESGEIAKEQGTFEDFVGAGNYTLVDFWASWCGPCRAEAPNVVAVYEKYHDKGLVVIGVPVNDKQEASEKAMNDLGIHYPQVLDPSMALAERFNVEGIPYIILFAPDGSIVAANLRGAQIEEAVKKVLK
jgi:thiol-disulfide isomerase/thioredoxin